MRNGSVSFASMLPVAIPYLRAGGVARTQEVRAGIGLNLIAVAVVTFIVSLGSRLVPAWPAG